MLELQVTEDDCSQAAGGSNARGNIRAQRRASGHLKEAHDSGKSGPEQASDALAIHPAGFEPATCPLGGGCSIQLNYWASQAPQDTRGEER